MLSKPDAAKTEKELAADLEQRLSVLAEAKRCEWYKETRMLCFTHSIREQASTLRIDYVARIDGNLVGFEVKKSPERAADLGRYMLQCAQYAHGKIAASTVDRINPEWIGLPLWAVFLVTSSHGVSDYVLAHGRAAHRLFGPANVGFFIRECRHSDCFELRLCGDRVWSKEWGWHRGMVNKTSRVGNGSFHAVDTEEITFPASDEDAISVGFPFPPSADDRW